MERNIEQIGDFFDQYALQFNRALTGNPDIDALTSAFAEHFIEASPTGVNAGSNNDSFKETVAGGLSFYRSIGIRSMEIQKEDISFPEAIHVLVKINWKSTYSKGAGGQGTVEFDVFYLVQDRGVKKKIFCYIAGDEQKVLQELGLIPSPTDIYQKVM